MVPEPETYPFPTLPDYLAPHLVLVFVGINPGLYSLERGHYFARPTSRFWPAFSRSILSTRIRAALGRDVLGPGDDGRLLAFGIGFTDVVKVPSRNAAGLRRADFQEWAPRLAVRLRTYKPIVACFHGLTGYRPFARYGLAGPGERWSLGAQPLRADGTRLFVVPNPSPANAHVRLRDQIAWYDRLAKYLRRLAPHAL
ncbi:MAG TPA: mismatch-specific DNA-glycosylase [bacterium]|nr:mismatch-specific DNA-glycosylase [bacterium]